MAGPGWNFQSFTLVLLLFLYQLPNGMPDLLNTMNIDMCKWKPIVHNGKLRGGIGAGTFHRLGYTPNMETCVDLCCNMDVCGVAFRNKDDCFGIECNSDDSCESVPAAPTDVQVEIAHVRAGKRSANLTDLTLAGQCRPSPIYKEVTLKGGINAGTYKDVGGVSTMEECQKKCCEFAACDLAFMLAGSCYLVGCADQKQCAMQQAKQSKFHPSISYVTRWNNEGVKHTVFLQDAINEHYTCPKMVALPKVTLKGGLQAGDFTDVGKVTDIGQCYDICCQQSQCNLAFMLGQNCFSVACKDKSLCATTPAQPSIFNPQIAYVLKRDRLGSNGTAVSVAVPAGHDAIPIVKSVIKGAYSPVVCPKTRVFDNMTLKGGIDAGSYKDHGKVSNIDICRRICCEMTECHLAFLLGENCFSVKCANVDACRLQKAKPSTYSPRISYIRKVGSNELLKSEIPESNAARKSNFTSSTSLSSPAVKASIAPVHQKPSANLAAALGSMGSSYSAGTAVAIPHPETTAGIQLSKKPDASIQDAVDKLKQSAIQTPAEKKSELEQALQPADSIPKTQVVKEVTKLNSNASLNASNVCAPGRLQANVTLKGGRKAGEFMEIKGISDMKECVKRCCEDRDQKCNLAFMLGSSCYSVACKEPELCRTVPAPVSKFNPAVQYVRGLEEEPLPPSTEAPKTTKDDDASAKKQAPTEKSDATKSTTPKDIAKTKTCVSQPIVKDKSLRGGKRAGKFKVYKDVKDMSSCVKKCCSLKAQCDLAYMEDSKCFSIQCNRKTACSAVDLRSSDISPQFAYMDHFLEKVEEEEAVGESATELDQAEVEDNSVCANVEIIYNKTLKGGTKAGKFKAMGKMKDMRKCISTCCDRPDCDIAYFLNERCFQVECTDGKLCQATAEPARVGDRVELAYMNKAGLGEKQRDFMVVYIIAGCLALAVTIGGFAWVVFAFSKKHKLKKHKRLLDEDPDEQMEELIRERPSRPRYRQPRY